MFCTQCGTPLLPTEKFCSKCGTALKIMTQPTIPQSTTSSVAIPLDVVVQVRPWVRFWARYIDMYLISNAISFLLSFTISFVLAYMSIHLTPRHDTQVFWSIVFISFFFWFFVEALLLSTFGTTPGKWLFKIKLALASGEPISYTQAVNRSFKVWWRGLGTGFPIVAAITQIVAYGKLKRNGVTSWDREGNFVVTHEHIGVPRILVAIVFFIIFSVITTQANHKRIARSVEASNPQVSTTSSSVSAQGSSASAGLFDETQRQPAAAPEPANLKKNSVYLDDLFGGPKKQTAIGEIAAEPEYTATEWFSKAVELKGKKDWAGLLNHALRWTQALPGDAKAWYTLGVAYYIETKQPSKAIEAFQQAIRINPELANAWFCLGIAYSDTKQPSKAIEAHQQAIRINPEDANAWFCLGSSYKISGQTSQVMEVYKRLKTLDPAMADKFFNKVVLP